MALGLKGDDFRLLRRISIDGFAVGNLIVQVLFITLYRPIRIETTQKLFRWLVVFCIALPAARHRHGISEVAGCATASDQ